MKKRIKTILICTVLTAVFTGCNFFNKDVEYNIDTAELFADNAISEDAEISTGRCNDIFTEALTAAIKNENITIDMNFISSFGQDESLINDISLKFDYAEKQKGSVKIVSNENGVETIVNGYYDDGYYYEDIGGVKTKYEKNFSEFLIENDGYTMNIDNNVVSKFGCVYNGDNKLYLVQLNPVAFENKIITESEATGNVLNEDETIIVEYSNIIFEVDKNNIMTGYDYVTKSQYMQNGELTDLLYKIHVDFKDINKTKLDVPEDIQSYVEAETDSIVEDTTQQ